MARTTKKAPAKKKRQQHETPLQLHVSHADFNAEVKGKLIDLTEIKLRKLFNELKTTENKVQVHSLLEKYIAGAVVVGWREGTIIYQDRQDVVLPPPQVPQETEQSIA